MLRTSGACAFTFIVLLGCGGSATPIREPARDPHPPAQPDATPAAEAQADEDARYADLLLAGAEEPEASGDLQRRPPGADLSAQIDEVAASGARVQVGGGTARGTRVNGADSTQVHGPSTPTPSPPPPGTTIAIALPRAYDESSLEPERVQAKLRAAYAAGLQRCFARELAAGGPDRATVAVRFAVDETGRVAPTSITAAPSLRACIEALVKSWRFDVPKDVEGEPTEASFDVSITFAPRP